MGRPASSVRPRLPIGLHLLSAGCYGWNSLPDYQKEFALGVGRLTLGREQSQLKSALRNLLSSEEGANVIGFLRERGARAHIVAPQWVQQRVLAGKRSLASWSQSIDPADLVPESKANFVIIADDASTEESIIRSLKIRQRGHIYGLFQHVLPAILSGANGMSAGQPLTDLTRYALLCVPRSGSRYLAAVLSNRGVGAPKEHIREPLANVITQGGLGFATAVSTLERYGQRNGIFGTKVISTFLIKASNRKMAELTANVTWMVDRGYSFILLERPLKEIVVSSYIAFLMKKWHFFGELDGASRGKLDNLVFEGGAAWEEYLRFRAEQIVINSLIASVGAPTVRYGEIESEVDGVVDRICVLLGVEQAKLNAGAARIPLAMRSESPTYARFAEQLDEVLHHRRDELQPRLVKKVRSLTSLGAGHAERLVEEAGICEATTS